jgi:hypothetical protein
MSDAISSALGEAAVEAVDAERALVRMVLRLEAAGLELSEEGIEVVDAVCEMATGMISIADRYGRLEVARRFGSAA